MKWLKQGKLKAVLRYFFDLHTVRCDTSPRGAFHAVEESLHVSVTRFEPELPQCGKKSAEDRKKIREKILKERSVAFNVLSKY